MQETTEAIFLRKTPYSSSSAVVSFYTRKFGQVAFLVRGLGKKGGKSAMLQPLTQVEIACNFKQSKQIQTALSLQLLNPGVDTHYHPYKAAVSIFLCEILNKTLQEEAPDEELYQFLKQSLFEFENSEYNPNFHLVFLMRLSFYFGFQPSGKPDGRTPYFDLIDGSFVSNKNQSLHTLGVNEAEVFYQIAQKAENGTDLILQKFQRTSALTNILEYYQIHMEGMGKIKSREILAEIFS